MAVYVEDQQDYIMTEIAEKVESILEKDDFDVENKSIFLKPSFVFPVPEKMIYTCTNPEFVAGVAIALDRLGASRILVAEGPTFGPARYNFSILGVAKLFKKAIKMKLLREKSVRFVYHDEVKNVKVDIPEPFIKNSFKVPKLLLDADYFISLPKLKVNIFADITLSVKNHLGLTSMKERLEHHNENLHKEIADLYRVRIPDFVITDAIVSGEGQGPMEATPLESNLIIAGRNGLSVNAVCCYMMGVDPSSIEHLRLLSEKKIGTIDINEITVKNRELLEQRKRKYILPDSDLENIAPGIKAYIGEKCCIPGCKGFLRALLDGYGKNLPDGFDNLEVTIIAGDGLEIPEEELSKINKKKTMVYGDCAAKYKKYGKFFKGCPPNYIKAFLSMRKPMGSLTPWWKHFSLIKFGWASVIHLLRKIFPHRIKLG